MFEAFAICVFLTEGDIETPILITLRDTAEPSHPEGKRWRLFARFHANPRRLLVGKSRVDRLLKDGYLIEDLALEDLLRRRVMIAR